MQTEQVFEISRSDTNEVEQHAKLFQALCSTANTGSVAYTREKTPILMQILRG